MNYTCTSIFRKIYILEGQFEEVEVLWNFFFTGNLNPIRMIIA